MYEMWPYWQRQLVYLTFCHLVVSDFISSFTLLFIKHFRFLARTAMLSQMMQLLLIATLSPLLVSEDGIAWLNS